MKIILNKNKLIKYIHKEKNLGLVPTMGGIHSGHMSLIKKSIKMCDKTIVTIFVNKPQFNRKNDYLKYPRVLNKDISILRKLKVSYLYLPTHKQIYPAGPNKKIKISTLGKKLCGKSRPGHFEAVADVIERFIKIIKPKKIFFGEKDMQQLKIINHYVKLNNLKSKIIGCKTVREKNGIACSSRNYLLSKKEKNIASNIFKLIKSKKNFLLKKNSLNYLKNEILKLGARKIDYIEKLNINRMIKPYYKKNKYRIFVAYYLGSTRLIDNI
mgnify:CR=1 FL=1